MVPPDFFDQDPRILAPALLGKVLRHRVDTGSGKVWLAAQIIETEAYLQTEKASHSSLGYTPSRRAMFMPPGTIYMYYARGGDSLNFSARGHGNAVLIKSAITWVDQKSPQQTITIMQSMNPVNGRIREPARLLSGQTILCKSLGLKVNEWNERRLTRGKLVLEDVGYQPEQIVRTTRLGIPTGRDEQLPYRFVDASHAKRATKNPLSGPHEVFDQNQLAPDF